MEYLDECNLTLSSVASLKFADQSEHFYGFLMYVKHGRHTGTFKEVKNNTAYSYLQVVFGFYTFLNRNGDLPYLRVLDARSISYTTTLGTTVSSSTLSYDGYLKKNESVSRMASREDILKILSACTNNRDRLLIILMEETGLRIGEALGLKYTEDIDFAKKRVYVRYRSDNKNLAFAKYAEERYMKMSDTAFDLLSLYLSEYTELFEKTDYLFIVLHGNTKGSPLKADTFYAVLKDIGTKCGLHVTNHMLRHYFADERRRASWPIVEISKALGHKHISTTEKYLHVSPREIEDAQDEYLKKHATGVNISSFI